MLSCEGTRGAGSGRDSARTAARSALASLAFGLVALLVLSTGAAQAALMEIDWKVAADGLLMLDSETNQEWLDLTASSGVSYSDVEAEFGLGGDFEGFRHATTSEVEGLWNNAGIPNIGSDATADNAPPVLTLLGLVGDTSSQAGLGITSARGLLDEPIFGSCCHKITLLEHNPFDFNPARGRANLSFSNASDVGSSSSVGHWLVRVHVPEPTTAWLLIAGLAACSRGSQRRQNDPRRQARSRATL